ncbi:MAG: hypothetical protein RIC95_02610 [Vicingaceae bacterium]
MSFSHHHTFKEHKGAVYALCQGKESHIAYTAGSDRHVVAWDLEQMQALKVVARSPTTVISLLYLEKWDYLLIGQVEGGVHIIDLSEGKEVKYLKNHQAYIFDLQFIPEKDELIMVSGDGSFSVWSMPEGKRLFQKKLTDKKIREIDYSPERKEIAIALGDGRVQLRSSEDYSEKEVFEAFDSSVNVVRYQAQTDKLWVGEKDALLSSIDLKSLKKSPPLAAHYWAIYDIAFNQQGLMATASRDKTLKIWDTEEPKVLKRFEGLKDQAHSHSVNKLLWTNYHHFLLSTGDDGSLKVWQVSA